MISFNTISDIIKITREESVTFSDVIITYETHSQQKPRTEIIADMYGNWDVMKTAIVNGLQTSEKSFSGQDTARGKLSEAWTASNTAGSYGAFP